MIKNLRQARTQLESALSNLYGKKHPFTFWQIFLMSPTKNGKMRWKDDWDA